MEKVGKLKTQQLKLSELKHEKKTLPHERDTECSRRASGCGAASGKTKKPLKR